MKGMITKALLVELLKGMRVTFRTMLKPIVTLQYPKEREEPRENFRGIHALKLNKDGTYRCEACYLCATMCPSNVIDMEMEESPNGMKVLVDYRVDLSKCLFCGLCVEACPRDAIVLTDIYEFSKHIKRALILNKQDLMEIGRYYQKWEERHKK